MTEGTRLPKPDTNAAKQTWQSVLRWANEQVRRGNTREAVDAHLQQAVGITYQKLANTVGSLDFGTGELTTRDLLRSGAVGATLGFWDELAGGAAAITSLDPSQYKVGRDASRRRQEDFRERHPMAAFLSEIYGGLVPAIAAGAPGGAASKLAPGMSAGARIGGAASAGASFGAVAGAGHAEELEDVPKAAATGGALGSLLGLGLGTAGAVGGAVIPPVARFAAASLAPVRSGVRQARQTLGTAARRTGRSAADMLERTDEMLAAGRAPILADLDPQFERAMRAAVNEATGDVGQVLEDVTRRSLGQGGRLASDLAEVSGLGTRSFSKMYGQLKDQVSAAGRRVFGPLEEAYPSVTSEKLTAFLKDPDIEAVWNSVRPRGGKEAPGFIHWQALRQRIRDEARAAGRTGRTALQAKLNGAIPGLDDLLAEVMPEYAAANAEYAAWAATKAALQDGYDSMLKAGANPAEVSQALQAATAKGGPGAGQAYRNGMVQGLMRRLRAMAENRKAGQQLMVMSPDDMALLKLALPEEQLERFLAGAAAEQQIGRTSAAATGGSTTAAQQNDQGMLKLGGSAHTKALGGKLLGFLGPPDEFFSTRANEMGRLLTGPAAESISELGPYMMPRSSLGIPKIGAGLSAGQLPRYNQ
jgi:hypothetical protein